MKKEEVRIEELKDIIAAQNELIAEQQQRIKELEVRISGRCTPAQVVNGVLVKPSRVFI